MWYPTSIQPARSFISQGQVTTGRRTDAERQTAFHIHTNCLLNLPDMHVSGQRVRKRRKPTGIKG